MRANGTIAGRCRYHQGPKTVEQVAEEVEQLLAMAPELAAKLASRRRLTFEHEERMLAALVKAGDAPRPDCAAVVPADVHSLFLRLVELTKSKRYELGDADPSVVAQTIAAMVVSNRAELDPEQVLERAIGELRDGAGLRDLYLAVHAAMWPTERGVEGHGDDEG